VPFRLGSYFKGSVFSLLALMAMLVVTAADGSKQMQQPPGRPGNHRQSTMAITNSWS